MKPLSALFRIFLTATLLGIATGHGSPYLDAFRNTRSDGSWLDASGASHIVSSVRFAELPVPVKPATWGGIQTLFGP